jgi:hypothetical protein
VKSRTTRSYVDPHPYVQGAELGLHANPLPVDTITYTSPASPAVGPKYLATRSAFPSPLASAKYRSYPALYP